MEYFLSLWQFGVKITLQKDLQTETINFETLESCFLYLSYLSRAPQEKNLPCGEIFPHCNVEIFSCDKLSWGKSSAHEKCETTL